MPKYKRKIREKVKGENQKWHDGLKAETKHSILAIVFFGLAVFFTLAAYGKTGIIGNFAYRALEFSFGSAFFLIPAFFLLGSLLFFFSLRPNLVSATLIGGIIFLLSSLGLINVIFGEKRGGYLGFLVSSPFLRFFEFWGSFVLLAVFFIMGILVMFDVSLRLRLKKEEKKEEPFSAKSSEGAGKEDVISSFRELLSDFRSAFDEKKTVSPLEPSVEMPKKIRSEDKDEISLRHPKKIIVGHFHSPPLDIFEGDKGKPSTGDIKANANIIKRTLQNFGVDVEMAEVTIGPSVTQYTLKPAEGMKLSRIIALQNDLSLALAAHPIRIEAPIPGKSLVGIEVPNSAASLVGLHNLFAQEEFRKSERPLLLALGRNVAGHPVYADLSQMPHLLIAGATGSGKSVGIHALISSLVFRNSPENLRLLLIDPKRVELTIYDDLPHLLSPVIIEAKKAISALKWLTKEMERRYDILLGAKCRDVIAYQHFIAELPTDEQIGKESMPYIIVVIDELADLMATYPREFEASIVRLAQMSRAVGIHLVLSTQRPSVEVLTGLIKANITSRIAFQVATQVDSRTTLDMAGAEKLLGNGDMLYLAGDTAKPRRVQGAFVSEKEIKRLTKYLKDEYMDSDLEELEMAPQEIENSSLFDDSSEEIDDELYEKARELVIEAQKASSSYFQRRLKIGYARAARLIDMLEERGVVGPGEGAKPREVFIKPTSSMDEERIN